MFKHLINLFFPKVCAGCNTILLMDEQIICTKCRHEIPLTNHHLTENNEVIQKFYGRIPLEFGAALFYFHKKGIVQEVIHHLKYKGNKEISCMIGNWYAEELKDVVLLQQIDFVVPVPIHKKRFQERGYNQVEGFGRAIANKLNIPYEDSIIFRKMYTKTQTKKNLLGRIDVIDNVFEVRNTESYIGKHFLLVDDVITTGSTLEACSRALLKIPNCKISIICMAMAQS